MRVLIKPFLLLTAVCCSPAWADTRFEPAGVRSAPRSIDASGAYSIDASGKLSIDASGKRRFSSEGTKSIDASGAQSIDASGKKSIDASGTRSIDASGILSIDASGVQSKSRPYRVRALKSSVDEPASIDASGVRALSPEGTLRITGGVVTKRNTNARASQPARVSARTPERAEVPASRADTATAVTVQSHPRNAGSSLAAPNTGTVLGTSPRYQPNSQPK